MMAFLEGYSIKRNPSYVRALKRYKSLQKNISSAEIKIITYPYEKKLHEKLKSGGYKGYSHARVNQNLRILYVLDEENKEVILMFLFTKNELEKF